MISGGELSNLYSKAGDDEFHGARVMFCIKDGKIEVAPLRTVRSHIEWFEDMGWVTSANTEDFLKANPRGFFWPKENTVYCYWGVGYGFDENIKAQLLSRLQALQEALGLNGDTEICFGPKDSPLQGKEWPQVCLGTIKELKD